ncbi:MAG: 3-oxoacyl-[acyl-carrier protein] reductase [Polyangiaceae bacterium]|nr:3-oxoacyl-[acyl-carrier protein] reductase [Polyangiaceae bacterium]
MTKGAPSSLRGKRALVTGAGQRVGQAIALALGAEGMHVAVHYRESRAGAEETARRIVESGGRATLLAADLSSREEARGLVDSALTELGGLDLVVASAASFERVALADVDDAAWDRSLDLNLASPFALVHRAVPALRATQGSVVFVTCSSATVPMRGYLPYVVSKGALKHLMKTLALELSPDIRVNAVAPGTVMPPPSYDEAAIARLARAIPLARVGSPEDIARAVVYLATSPFVTGHELAVDGGRSVARSEHFG